MDHYAKAYPLYGRIRGFYGRRFQDMLHSLRRFSESEIAEQRMKIIKFYEKYGEKATKEAFGADRKVISRWRKRLREGGGHLSSLIPYSTRPHRIRTSNVHQEVIDFIKELREKYPRIGKEKIKPLLDEYCVENKLKTISESTIGNIIKRHKFFYQKSGRIYHNPNSKWAQKRVKKRKRLRIRHPLKPEDFGHIVADTVERVTDGVKDYFYSAIDAKMKFAITLNYKTLNSRNMKDFYQRFKSVYPGTIKSWQTDNGKENLLEFDEELKREKIQHYFSYPRCPKINTYIERYNRTIQEEFIDNNLDIIHDKPLFHKKLAEYLIFYNTKRPHKSLGLKSPIDYLIENGGMSQKSLTYTIN
jgi:transposase InsO family protein